ncbi:MAG: glutamate racemase [bacterium]
MTAETYGFFDSGVGGLTVLRSFQRIRGDIDFVYFGDTEHCPYGDRPLSEVREFAMRAVSFLKQQGCDKIVMACNISSSVALEPARSRFPSLEIEGLINDRMAQFVRDQSDNGIIGVLATQGTVDSGRYKEALETSDVRVVQQACSPLVPLVETGQCSGDLVQSTLEPLTAPLIKENVDTVVLGCTHYPFLAEAIANQFSDHVTIVDPGRILARTNHEDISVSNGSENRAEFFVSGESDSMRTMLDRMYHRDVPEIQVLEPSEVPEA